MTHPRRPPANASSPATATSTTSGPETPDSATTGTCWRCGLWIRLRPAHGDWIARDEDGLSWLSCYGADVAEDCATCSGTRGRPRGRDVGVPDL